MGNDGGSIPKRRELVKEAARNPTVAELKESQLEYQSYHWTTDPISQEPLAPPIVSDATGKLYNKDTILEYLVESKRREEGDRVTNGAVRSLKDVVDVHFDLGPESAATSAPAVWHCPITGDRLGPGSKAVYLVPCGHAFSGRAIKEVSGEKCLVCETAYASNDVIPIVPTTIEDVAHLTLRAKTLQENGLTHSLKKASGGNGKKRRKRDDNTAKAKNDHASDAVDRSKETETKKTNINNASTASLTAKVLDEQERAKKRKMNDNVSSLFSSRDPSKPTGKSADFMTRGFSIASTTKN